MTLSVRAAVAAAVVMSLACSVGDPPTSPVAHVLASPASTLVIHPYGIGSDRSPGRACSAPEYRQFDFWLGSWDVFVPGGAFAGTNIVERELDGCVVEENWTDGGRGRSLNVYDANDRMWHQHWVYSGGGPVSVLILDGSSPGAGSLWMRGARRTPAGASIRDSIAWTAITPDSVRQHWSISINGAAFVTSFDGRYRRVGTVTPIPVGFIPTCTNRAANHQFDFLLGSWNVTPARGHGQGLTNGPITMTVTSDLDHCLIEEKIDGPGGYRGWSFSGYQPGDQQWRRTYVDNLGQRLLLTGGLVGENLVLVGSKRTPTGDEVLVRLTYEISSPSQVTQRWEASRDGGTSWIVELETQLVKAE